jgi:hypothetical protein
VYQTPPSAAGATSCGCDPGGTGNSLRVNVDALDFVAVKAGMTLSDEADDEEIIVGFVALSGLLIPHAVDEPTQNAMESIRNSFRKLISFIHVPYKNVTHPST